MKNLFFLSCMLLSVLTQAQHKITGTVIDAKEGYPLPGTMVKFKGTSVGTFCDKNGNFELEIDDPNNILSISFIGYHEVEELVNNRTHIKVLLYNSSISKKEIAFFEFDKLRENAKCYEGNCLNGISVMKLNNGNVYVGNWKNGYPHGEGCLFAENGKVVEEGIWKNSYLKKESTTSFTNKFPKYIDKQGCLEGDCFNGYGVLKAKKMTYKGAFKNGKMDGFGEVYFGDTLYYKGNLKQNKKHGQGKVFLGGILRYDGNFEMGKKHGQGKLYYYDTLLYDGNFNMGVKEGQGTIYYTTFKYTGRLKNGKKHGQGSLIFYNGIKVSGIWADDTIWKGKRYDNDILLGYYWDGKLERIDAYYTDTEEEFKFEVGCYNSESYKNKVTVNGITFNLEKMVTNNNLIVGISATADTKEIELNSEEYYKYMEFFLKKFNLEADDLEQSYKDGIITFLAQKKNLNHLFQILFIYTDAKNKIVAPGFNIVDLKLFDVWMKENPEEIKLLR